MSHHTSRRCVFPHPKWSVDQFCFPSCITAMSPVLIFCNLGSAGTFCFRKTLRALPGTTATEILWRETANKTEPTALFQKTPCSSFLDKQKGCNLTQQFPISQRAPNFRWSIQNNETQWQNLSPLSLSLSTYTHNIYVDKYISPSESVQGGSCSISFSLYKVYTLQFSSQPLKCSFVTLPTLPSLTLRASTLPPQHFASPWPGSVDWPSPHSNLGAEL